jgi:hypothetical protein
VATHESFIRANRHQHNRQHIGWWPRLLRYRNALLNASDRKRQFFAVGFPLAIENGLSRDAYIHALRAASLTKLLIRLLSNDLQRCLLGP